ncbi:hypothetical protein RFI_14658 [Reticulomyxa filosa]|uniref:RGS domain-containing protein n=1 Tax=Reticulomyxa filosa TaxID=46433 RepID=X6N9E6_RETFI|nr:hypothetical protein RFI_14658 [Reticulomyxa filosa]|eukprot:ETO22543.1 hypothetical protein RFI_14658 [Reticulomyxa filosa]
MIVLRPKDLYYSVLDTLNGQGNCFRVRRRYRQEYNTFRTHSSLDARTIASMKPAVQSTDNSIRRNAIELSCQISLEKILSDKYGFELFAAHLVKELSLENILFLTEYMQLKHFIVVHQLQKYVTDIGCLLPICPNLIQKNFHPRLLQTTLSAPTIWFICLNMFHYLYGHYVMSGSVALLNLSFETSSNITRQMTELRRTSSVKSLQPLITAFDIAASDIIRLLRGDSFYRFQLSRECIRYCEELV